MCAIEGGAMSKNYIIFGASQGLGDAFVKGLLQVEIQFGLYREVNQAV